MSARHQDENSQLPIKLPSLKRNVSWTALGNIIYAICQWGVIAALAKIGDAEMVGVFALGLAVVTPIQIFSQLQLRGIQATDAREEYDFADYFTLRSLTTVAAVIISVLVSIGAGYGSSVGLIIALIALAKAVDSMSDVFFGGFQQREQMDSIAKALVGKGVLSLAGLTIGVAITGDLVAGSLGYLAGSILPLVVYTVPVFRKMTDSGDGPAKWFAWKPGRSRALAWLALPLGVVMLLNSLTSNLPRYFIESSLGFEALGLFSAVAYLMVAGTTVISAIGQSASPRLARLFAAGEIRQFRKLLMKMIAAGVALGVLGSLLSIVAGSEVLTILYTPEYAEYDDILILLAIAAGIGFASAFTGVGLTAARKFAIQLPVSVIATLITLAACALLIPRYGLEGAAISVGVGSFSRLVLFGAVLVGTIKRAESMRGVNE